MFALYEFNKENLKVIESVGKSGKIKTVVALLPSVEEVIYEIGAFDMLVGVSQYCNYPEKVKKLPVVGGYKGMDYEKIAKMRPDVVIGSDMLKGVKEKLEKLNIRYFEVKQKTVEDIYNSILSIGKLLGKEENAKKFVEKLKDEVKKQAKKIKKYEGKKVLIVIGSREGLSGIYLAGKNTFFDEILNMLGLKNAYAGSLQYPSVTPEDVIKMNPDIIFLLNNKNVLTDAEKKRMTKEWYKLPDVVNAVKNKKIFVLNGDYVFIPGPRFVKIMEKITATLK
jgi:iron complex transport system substrate-binding protein